MKINPERKKCNSIWIAKETEVWKKKSRFTNWAIEISKFVWQFAFTRTQVKIGYCWWGNFNIFIIFRKVFHPARWKNFERPVTEYEINHFFRKRFDDNYALQVHEIIHSNLTRRQRRKLAIDRFKNSISQKVYEYTPSTIQSRTDMAVKYANNKKKVVLDNISMPHRRATLLFNFIPFCIVFLVLLPIMHDKELEDGVSWKTAEAMYPEHKYFKIHYVYGWWLAVRRGSFYVCQSIPNRKLEPEATTKMNHI